jgi:hypothetical protein
VIEPLLLAAAVAASPSPSPTGPAVVTIDGALVRASYAVDATVRARLPHVSVMAAEHDGSTHAFSGIRLADALDDAGAPTGDRLRGSAARAYVLVTAADGYAAVYALGELDTADARCAPLLVDRRDGAPLAAENGPIGIVAPCDRTHARWVRSVATLTVVVTTAPTSPIVHR